MEFPPAMELPESASLTFEEVRSHGPPSRPLEFPPPVVGGGVRVNGFVMDLSDGTRNIWPIIHRDFSANAPDPNVPFDVDEPDTYRKEYVAYAPFKRLQNAIYGSVWACRVLRRHYDKVATAHAAHAAGVAPGSPDAPLVWETTNKLVAIKMVEWGKLEEHRGRLLEDPIKEIAAMQMIGSASPHVLGPIEILQDPECLYIVMPYCAGGDLFGVVVKYAEDCDGEMGMPEPVARYWFRQILKGLLHLQSVGVCHRDLSLENVLVDTDNCIVIDMGMCLYVPHVDPADRKGRSTVDATRGTQRRLMIRPQGTCGKSNYMSPEIFSNKAPFDGYSIDVWAAGVILYIMLTGFPPYDQAHRSDQKFDIIVRGDLVRQLRDWGIRLSTDAGDLLQSMLQEDPRDRLSLAEVWSHPWVVTGESHAPPPPRIIPHH